MPEKRAMPLRQSGGLRTSPLTAILCILSKEIIPSYSHSSFMSSPAGGKRVASRRLPGMKHGPLGIGFMLFGREFSESARSPSSLRVRQVAWSR